jgi:hypothetical protein
MLEFDRFFRIFKAIGLRGGANAVQSGQTVFRSRDLRFHLPEGVLASQQIPISVSNPPPIQITFAVGGRNWGHVRLMISIGDFGHGTRATVTQRTRRT